MVEVDDADALQAVSTRLLDLLDIRTHFDTVEQRFLRGTVCSTVTDRTDGNSLSGITCTSRIDDSPLVNCIEVRCI